MPEAPLDQCGKQLLRIFDPVLIDVAFSTS